MALGFRTNNVYNQEETQIKTVTPYKYARRVLPDAGYTAMTAVDLTDVPKYEVAPNSTGMKFKNSYGTTVVIAKNPANAKFVPIIQNGQILDTDGKYIDSYTEGMTYQQFVYGSGSSGPYYYYTFAPAYVQDAYEYDSSRPASARYHVYGGTTASIYLKPHNCYLITTGTDMGDYYRYYSDTYWRRDAVTSTSTFAKVKIDSSSSYVPIQVNEPFESVSSDLIEIQLSNVFSRYQSSQPSSSSLAYRTCGVTNLYVWED